MELLTILQFVSCSVHDVLVFFDTSLIHLDFFKKSNCFELNGIIMINFFLGILHTLLVY